MAILAGTLALAGLLPATASAGAGLTPTGEWQAVGSADVDSLASYVTKGKIKVQRKVRFLGTCSADCSITVRMTLVVPGPNLIANPPSMTFTAGQIYEGFIDLGAKANVAFLKKNKKKSKLRTKVNAVNTVTGDTDADQRTFKFK